MSQPSSQAQKNTGRQSFSDSAYRELKRRILENEFSIGEQYLEQEIAGLLNMSRTPIREALVRLANEGLVEIRPRHGMRVKAISLKDVGEIYEILTALESSAAALATEKGLPDAAVTNLRQAVANMDSALEADDLSGWAAADERFHRLLVELSGNERLQVLVGTFMDQSHRLRMLTLRLRPKPTASNIDHRAVIDAIVKGDADSARRLHRQHREKSGRMLIGLLETHGLTKL